MGKLRHREVRRTCSGSHSKVGPGLEVNQLGAMRDSMSDHLKDKEEQVHSGSRAGQDGPWPWLGPQPCPSQPHGHHSVLTAPGAVKLRGEAEWQGQCLEQHLGQRRDSEGVGLSNPMTFENSKYYKEMKVTAAHYTSKSASPAARRKLPPPVATGLLPSQDSCLCSQPPRTTLSKPHSFALRAELGLNC